MKECKTLLDVRTNAEFSQGHVEGSVNIPIDQLGQRLEDVKGLPHPIAVCCASGGRSAIATDFLQKQSVDCFDAQGWKMAEFAIQNGMLCLRK